MAFRPKPTTDAMDADAEDQEVIVDLRPQNAQKPAAASAQPQKPDMRFDLSTFGSSDLASKLPSFLEEMARANRETQELMAADPKAARIEIDDDDEDEEEGEGGGRKVIEMNLYSGILESEDPKKKKEIVMPNGQVLDDGNGDAEPFISEPVEVRHTTGANGRKRRASSSSVSSSASDVSSSSSEGETRIIKIPAPVLEKDNVSRRASPESHASDASAAGSNSTSSQDSQPQPPAKIPTSLNGGGNQPEQQLHSKFGSSTAPDTSSRNATLATTKRTPSSPPAQAQSVQDWVNGQPSLTGDYSEIAGTPNRKMLVPLSRMGQKESQRNVQDWVNSQSQSQSQAQGQSGSGSTGEGGREGGRYPERHEKSSEN